MARTGKQNGSQRGRKRKDHALLKQQDCSLGLTVVHPKAAGIDVGNEEHYVAIPPSLDPEPVRKFGCFTRDLIALAEWLQERGIETVALQSTGVYWIGLYDILSERGIKVLPAMDRFRGECAGYQEHAGPEIGCARVSVVVKVARLWAAEELVPTERGNLRAEDFVAAAAAARGRRCAVYSAYAEGALANESATGQCD